MNKFIDGAWYQVDFKFDAEKQAFRIDFRGVWTTKEKEEFLRMFNSFQTSNIEHNVAYVFLQD